MLELRYLGVDGGTQSTGCVPGLLFDRLQTTATLVAHSSSSLLSSQRLPSTGRAG